MKAVVLAARQARQPFYCGNAGTYRCRAVNRAIWGEGGQQIINKRGEKIMNKEIWKKAVAFHGHECPSLAIGVRASQLVLAKFAANRAEDEELVCVTENDACGVDGIQVMLGCTMGKGNLIFRPTGKKGLQFF